MAKIIANGNEAECDDNGHIIEACETLGVPFGCYAGECGACKIEILEGAENLDELTEEEKNMGMDETHRLACQCKIKSGEVKIKF
jgi:ferredoxin